MSDLPTLPISRTLRLIADKLSEPHDQQSLLEAADMLERQSAELVEDLRAAKAGALAHAKLMEEHDALKARAETAEKFASKTHTDFDAAIERAEAAEAELETANTNHREMAKMLADMGRRLQAIETFCSGEDTTLGAIRRLAQVRELARGCVGKAQLTGEE